MNSLARKLTLCFFFCTFLTYSEEKLLGEYDAKAHYVYETIKHTTWPNDENLDTLRIAVVANDSMVFNALNNLRPANGIRDKRIEIEQISLAESTPLNFEIVYLTNRFAYQTANLVKNSSNTLIINEGSTRKDVVMVNLDFSGRKLEVRINRDNLVDKGFKISNSFLDFAGTKKELSDQLKEKQRYLSTLLESVEIKESELSRLNQQLQKQSEELKLSQDRLELSQSKLQQSQDRLKQQELDIAKGQSQLTEFKQHIASAESKLMDNQQRVQESLSALEKQQLMMTQREARIADMTARISKNQAVLDVQKKQIESQKILINDKERKIQEQRQLLIMVSGLVFAFLVMAYFLIRVNILRERHKRKLVELNAQLYELATTDSLTHIFNRRHFIESTETHLHHHLRSKSPAVMLMLDIDHFKNVNDTYGHPAGDKAIVTIANVLKSNLRPYDVVGRLGGEEFAMMLLDCEVSTAAEIAERLRQKIETTSIDFEEKTLSVTISIGLSCIHENDKDIDDVLVRADKALYEAKASGRNCIKIRTTTDHHQA